MSEKPGKTDTRILIISTYAYYVRTNSHNLKIKQFSSQRDKFDTTPCILIMFSIITLHSSRSVVAGSRLYIYRRCQPII